MHLYASSCLDITGMAALHPLEVRLQISQMRSLSPAPKRLFLALVILTPLVGGCSCNAPGGTAGPGAPAPARSPAEYSKIVSVFTVSALALETTDPTHTEVFLNQMTQIAPEEPAGWANLGL